MYWERYVLGWQKKQAQKWHFFFILGWAGSLMWHFSRDGMDLKYETGQAAAHHMASTWQPS
jgi:hypothetical protein